MRTKLRSKVMLLFMSLGLLLAIPAVAFATDVLTADGDTISAGNQAARNLGNVAPGATLTPNVDFFLSCAGGGDPGNPNLHFNSNDSASIQFNSSGSVKPSAAGAALSATNVGPFTGPTTWVADGSNCSQGGNPAPVKMGTSTVTITAPSAPGSYIYTVLYNVAPAASTTAGELSGAMVNDPVTFTLTVVQTDNTAPTTTASATKADNSSYTEGSWSNQNVSVTLAANDTGGSGLKEIRYTTNGSDPTATTGTVYTGPIPVTSTTALKYRAFDNAGNAEAVKTFQVNIDKIAPTITGSRTPGANANGWNNTNVAVSFSCNDTGGSGVDSCLGDTIVSTEGENQSVTGTVTDKAGNTASDTVGNINIDKTAPTITADRTPDPNSFGWNNTNVTVSYTCSDALSGLASSGCPASDTVTTEGANQSVSGSATDKAGNTATATLNNVNIDKTAPTDVVGTLARDPNPAGWYNASIDATFSGDDALSGIPANGCSSDGAYTGPDGTGKTVTGSCTDKAGNSASGSSPTFKYDATAPTITASRSPLANANGWNNSDVTVSFSCSDVTSGIPTGNCPEDVVVGEGANQSVTRSVTDAAGNTASATQGDINVDKTAPTITGSRTPVANSFGWNNTNVTVSFSCSDGLSGVASGDCPPDATVSAEGANQSRSGSVTDRAGNSASATVGNINIDKSAPTGVAFSGGGLTDGGSYDFGNVPAGPTGCTADGSISGLNSCAVSGYGTAVGPHTVTATAKDKAGNTATKTLSYSVAAATAKGFYQPVDMNGTLNTVKGGSAVPVKFELFGGATNVEQKALSAVGSMSASKVSCAAFTGDPVDAIEYLAPTSENTGLRFDTTGDQFIYNWKTPKSPNTCYSLTMTAADQQTKLVAYFKLT